ncbi:glycosyltransferase family 2 protein [Halomarina pelagica]|uniref:glycosyltransferase family 2 protein n=1 Tax=Halomarina pelagica TaxID=2961599 RepID=UPI0020C4B909|nr:glycosyltransferase family 2 protein [Halomarina sp. BND7]
MANRPTVSVVVPTYYRNDRLREAIDGALAQRAPVEVIVVDGSGEAHARPVVEAFDGTGEGDGGEIEYVAQARDEGPHAARSLGAERATGEYVQFLDDDDRLLPGKFEAQLPLLEADEAVGVVYSGLRDEEWGVVDPIPDVRGDVLEHALRLRTFPCVPSTMLVDRAVVDDLLPFEHRHGADDSGMKIELARRTRFDYVDRPLVERGKPDGTLSSSWAHVDGRRYLVRRYADLYDRYPDEVRRTAVRQTHYRAGNKHLEESAWSPSAPVEFARAAYHTPERRGRYAATAVASVFGRPGIDAADRLGIAP